ncbi:tetratricopeptide repeat protein [Sphingobacterium alimentarium]|uniref:Tetratricopeptide repeat protein n=1 Tax=Sphingobacterium alimentarium TaxID=797292 RepID=A0A4R3VRV6_9SPHI|nr:tetratricopeptide repeat protein [Sphingobacterium alimentarium]TCV11367.1 tetratricopeptide repeat protein [Sphingobacterium alimentarium]
MKLHIKTLLGVLAFLFFHPFSINAQDLDSDQLFALARKTAFDQKDYPKAIQLSKQALARSPEYTDIQVFLGRLYTWMDAVDSARMVFQKLELRQVQDADFHLAYAGYFGSICASHLSLLGPVITVQNVPYDQ